MPINGAPRLRKKAYLTPENLEKVDFSKDAH